MIDIDEEARKAVFAHEEYFDETYAMGYALDFARAYLALAARVKAADELAQALRMVVGQLRPGDDRADDAWADFDGAQVQQITDALAAYRATAPQEQDT